MAEALKNMYNPQFFEALCPFLQESIPGFPCRRFIYKVFNNEWPELELKQRVRHISKALHEFLPDDFPKAAALLKNLSTRLRRTGFKEQGFACIFIPDYIEVYGGAHPVESLEALEEITRLVSAEFAIRPFIINHEQIAMQKMFAWSRHEDHNVRRLSSEGCRPRLPWAMALPKFKKDPSSILPILENLKNDPSEYVRRSVANNLNDIAKDHPSLVLDIAKKWIGSSDETDWILKHGCRTLLKKGNEAVLTVHGFNSSDRAKVNALNLSRKKIKAGEDLYFDFVIENMEKHSKNFRIEYAIDYITSTGKISTKIFKVSEKTLEPKQPLVFKRKQSFRDLTTRKHYKGQHRLYIIANGKKLQQAEFTVC
jgi:3-methyladenine DNA glycosylase AlkC